MSQPFLALLSACLLLDGASFYLVSYPDAALPGQNPGTEDVQMPGISPDDTSMPAQATPPSQPRIPSAQRPGEFGY